MLRHDPEKHALGLDPGVDTGFRERSYPETKSGDESPITISTVVI
jgi:hypothetical protein